MVDIKGEKLEIDKTKDELALLNGVKVIRIDCNYDKVENRLFYIKENILKSNLSKIIDLSNINWNTIDSKIFEDNITKKVCDLRNKGYKNKEIANMLNVPMSIIDSRLKIGKNNGLLNKWAMLGNSTKTVVIKITNLENGEIQYCIGSRNFQNNTEKYIGIKANHHMFDKNTIDGHLVLNGYEIKKISYYDYLVKTAQI